MRIRRPSRRPAGSAAPSSTSKELLRRSPHLSRLLHPHSTALTCFIGTAVSSPTPRTKPRPTRRHQRGCTLIASHLLLNSTSRHRRCSIPHPHGAATLKPAPRATYPRRLSPSARPLWRRRPYQPDLLLLLQLSLARSRCCCCSGSRSIARSISCCCCSPPGSCRCSALIKPHFSQLNRLLGQSIFRGWEGSPELRKNHPQRGRGLAGEVPHYLC